MLRNCAYRNLTKIGKFFLIVLGLVKWVLMYHKVVERHSALLGYPHEEKISLVANHMSMCRFSGFEDSNYKDVAAALRRSVTDISKRATLPRRPISGSDSAKHTPCP